MLLLMLRLLYELLMLPMLLWLLLLLPLLLLLLPVAGATLRMQQKHLKMESRRRQFAVLLFCDSLVFRLSSNRLFFINITYNMLVMH